MLSGHAPTVARRSVIIGSLFDMAPIAARGQICLLVCAAVFERYDVINIPIIGRTELSLASVTAAVAVREDFRPPLRSH